MWLLLKRTNGPCFRRTHVLTCPHTCSAHRVDGGCVPWLRVIFLRLLIFPLRRWPLCNKGVKRERVFRSDKKAEIAASSRPCGNTKFSFQSPHSVVCTTTDSGFPGKNAQFKKACIFYQEYFSIKVKSEINLSVL